MTWVRLALLLTLALVQAVSPTEPPAPPIQNPTKVLFFCPDHAQDTGHAFEVRTLAGVVVLTLPLGHPDADANGVVTALVDLRALPFGTYTTVIRALAGAGQGEDSPPSLAWVRVPAAPGVPVLIRDIGGVGR